MSTRADSTIPGPLAGLENGATSQQLLLALAEHLTDSPAIRQLHHPTDRTLPMKTLLFPKSPHRPLRGCLAILLAATIWSACSAATCPSGTVQQGSICARTSATGASVNGGGGVSQSGANDPNHATGGGSAAGGATNGGVPLVTGVGVPPAAGVGAPAAAGVGVPLVAGVGVPAAAGVGVPLV
jgi:hypothetical protein